MKQDTLNGMRRVNVNVDLMAVFVIINDVGMKINVGMNVNNWLIKVCMIKYLFGILAIVSVNTINHVMLVNIKTIKNVIAEKLSW